MIQWIKKILGITALELQVKVNKDVADIGEAVQRRFINRKLAELKEYTRVDADVGYRGNNTIILTGVYKKQAYVKFYDMGDGEFENLVEMLKDKRDHCLIRHIDAPYAFHGVLEL